MLKNTIWRSTFLLYFLIMLIFLLVQILFINQEYFQLSPFQFLIATSVANAFVITTFTALIAANNMLKWFQKKNIGFFSVFKLTFIPGFLGGFLALLSIFAFFHFLEPQGIEQLKTEFLDYSLVQAKTNGDYDLVAERVNSPEVRNTSLLSFRVFTLVLGAILFFNLSLAILMSLLWKVRNTNK